MVINKTDCYDEDKIANYFNEYFTKVGPNLASKISSTEEHFTNYLNITTNIMPDNELSNDELNNAFKSLNTNKSPGYDEIIGKVVKTVFNEIRKPLMHIFNLSFKTGIFPDKMKIAKIIPLFKSEDAYFKITGGLLHGYKEPYEDKIPMNQLGIAPAIVPTFGVKYKRVFTELQILGTAAITWTAGFNFGHKKD